MERLMARQPIFDRQQRVFGYELLFRTGPLNAYTPGDGTEASTSVIANACFADQLEVYAGGCRAFINATREVLLRGHATMLPPKLTVIEVTEKVGPDAEVLAACRDLRTGGYTLALDGYFPRADLHRLLEVVDLVKIDFLQTSRTRRGRLARQLADQGKQMVAEKLEDRASFQEARDLGYDFFQGYFFAQPEMIRRQDMAANKLHYLELLTELHQPSYNVSTIEEIIKADVALTYKLLRYINSAFFGVRLQVHSVRHALLVLGAREVRKWASFVALTEMAEGLPLEVLSRALIRARFCELLAKDLRMSELSQDLFLMGMLSMIDLIVGRPIVELTQTLPIDDDIKAALAGRRSRPREVLDCVLAHEHANWAALDQHLQHLGLAPESIADCFRESILWARDLSSRQETAA